MVTIFIIIFHHIFFDMNTIVLAYGAILIILGVVGYLQSGSPTSFIGSAAGALALVGGYLAATQGWGKWLAFGAALLVVIGVGMRLPAAFQKIGAGEASIGEYGVRLAMVGLSIAFAIYAAVGMKSPETAA
jgi:uncharacterized membrane protein (UPF0136 family)